MSVSACCIIQVCVCLTRVMLPRHVAVGLLDAMCRCVTGVKNHIFSGPGCQHGHGYMKSLLSELFDYDSWDSDDGVPMLDSDRNNDTTVDAHRRDFDCTCRCVYCLQTVDTRQGKTSCQICNQLCFSVQDAAYPQHTKCESSNHVTLRTHCSCKSTSYHTPPPTVWHIDFTAGLRLSVVFWTRRRRGSGAASAVRQPSRYLRLRSRRSDRGTYSPTPSGMQGCFRVCKACIVGWNEL